MNFYKSFILLLFLIITQNYLFAQDSLYLVGTVQGEFSGKQIMNVHRTGDINGDGFDDFIISFPEANYCNIYLGSNNFDLVPDIVLNNPNNIHDFGFSLGDAGDVNNDGYDDFIVQGKYNPQFYVGKVFLYLGGENFNNEPFNSFNDHFIQDALGASISSGDINGDGYSDYIIGNPYNWTNGRGRAYLFLGKETLIDTPFVTFISDSLEDLYGSSVSMNGDINGDGFNDLLICVPYWDGGGNDTAKCFIYFGGDSIANNYNYQFDIGFSERIKIIGDVNNDGYDDFLISEGSINPRLYFGSSNFTADSLLEFSAYKKNDNFGFGFGGIGDINNDGYSDFAINIKNFINSQNKMVGKLNIYLGSSVVDTIPDFTLEGETKWGYFGKEVGRLGDINGDGYEEFFVFAPFYPNSDNPTGKVYIYTMKKFIVGIEKGEQDKIQQEFKLYQSYPNPFNPSTTLSYSLPTTSNVKLEIYDVMGRMIKSFTTNTQSSGKHKFVWDGTNSKGVRVSSGIYIYRFEATSLETNEHFIKSAKLMLVK